MAEEVILHSEVANELVGAFADKTTQWPEYDVTSSQRYILEDNLVTPDSEPSIQLVIRRVSDGKLFGVKYDDLEVYQDVFFEDTVTFTEVNAGFVIVSKRNYTEV